MKLLLNLMLVLAPALAPAAAGHGEDPGEIPTVIIYQAINVVILAVGLVYFSKESFIAFFAERRTAYLAAAEKSAFVRAQAEKDFVDIKNKLGQIEMTRADSLRKAQAHAESLKTQIADEADAVIKRIRDDAQLTAKLEIEKARRNLRTQLLKDSVEASRGVLTKDVGVSNQQKLQKDFVNHLEV